MNQLRKYIRRIFKLEVIIPLLISGCFLIGLSFSVELKYAVLVSFFILVIFLFFMMIDRKKERYFAANAVFMGGFKQLLNSELLDVNFKINGFDETNSLTGTYRGYDFDIVYDSGYSHNFWGIGRKYGGHVFIVYHQPISLRKNLQLDERYYPGLFTFRPYTFVWNRNYVKMQTALSLVNPSCKKIIKRMDAVVEVLEKEKMLPVKKGRKIQ